MEEEVEVEVEEVEVEVEDEEKVEVEEEEEEVFGAGSAVASVQLHRAQFGEARKDEGSQGHLDRTKPCLNVSAIKSQPKC